MNTFARINEIIDYHLQISHIGKAPHYLHKSSALELSRGRKKGFDAQNLISDMYSAICEGWDNSYRQEVGPSQENWRFEKQLHIDESNTSLEKILEKRIVRLTEEEWVNQVPTASGLFSSFGDHARNIDLVRRINQGEYEFFELKVDRNGASDTPLQAALEILQYGLLYIFSRCSYPERRLESKELLSFANTIHLSVLATYLFYDPCYNLGWFGREIDRGIKAFVTEKHLPFVMDFQYKSFSRAFRFSPETSDDELLHALEEIKQFIW